MLGYGALGQFAIGQATGATIVALSADAGAFVLSGQALDLPAGAFSLSGQAVLFPLSAVASVANFALSGQAAALAVSMPANLASFVESGQAALFSINMQEAVGTITVAFGQFISITMFTEAPAAFVVSGQAADLFYNLDGRFNWSGDAEMEFVGTTPFISLVEDGAVSLSYAAEIHLRSL